MNSVFNFFGIKFYNLNFKKIFNILNKKGGYLVAPAASSLSYIKKDYRYYLSLKKSRVAIFDSGFFCILLRIFKNTKVKKYSGYKFLYDSLNYEYLKKKSFFLINPNLIDSKKNLFLLRSKKIFNVKNYVAPYFNNKNDISESNLLIQLNRFKPNIILINIRGEIQERLALYIHSRINFKTIILCTGAAIAFMTRQQAPVNLFYDKYYLGWLIRLIYNPKIYFSRILKSLNLINLFFNNFNR